jgi:D-cysteine desulfhydrase
MAEFDLLQSRFPRLRDLVRRVPLANLPTPVRECSLQCGATRGPIWIKEDDRTAELYGGNKVRKLEYLFGRIDSSRFERVATYGTVASNHVLATALHARQLGFAATAFLAHQTPTPLARAALEAHLRNGTELIPFVGDYSARLRLQREHLWNRSAAVIPMGGSSWTGCLGFVNAGLELAGQIATGELPCPHRIYVASGTMGTVAGLAIGLALDDLPVDIQAIRVSHAGIANEDVLERLMARTCTMLHRIDEAFPADLHRRARVTLRHEFFGAGYAKSTPETDAAMALAARQAGLALEPTYTGKAMAALIADLPGSLENGRRLLFWNTYHGLTLPADGTGRIDRDALDESFERYFG